MNPIFLGGLNKHGYVLYIKVVVYEYTHKLFYLKNVVTLVKKFWLKIKETKIEHCVLKRLDSFGNEIGGDSHEES